MGFEVDIRILAEEAPEEPVLFLPAILALPHPAEQFGRQVVEIGLRGLRDHLDQVRRDAHFLLQFAQGGLAHVLAFVDPALRHLPEAVGRGVDPLADKDKALAVHQHEAGAGAIGQVIVAHAGFASMNCIAAMTRSRSRCVLGTIWRRLVKECVTPRISRNTQSRPASTSALA